MLYSLATGTEQAILEMLADYFLHSDQLQVWNLKHEKTICQLKLLNSEFLTTIDSLTKQAADTTNQSV